MSEAQDKEAKTEDATEKRLIDAKAKGQVAFSREIPIVASTLAIWAALSFLITGAAARISIVLRPMWERPGDWSLASPTDVAALAGFVLIDALAPLLPILGLICAAGVAAAIAQSRGVAVERIRPQASRISPIKGWSRIFGREGLGHAFKSLVGLVLVGCVSTMVLLGLLRSSVGLSGTDPGPLLIALPEMSARLVLLMLACMLVVAAVDLALTRLSWRRNLRMTLQEVKDEARETEGDPLVKGRIRMLARRRARSRMMAAVPRATVVITNPTHFAVALRYVSGETAAPLVVAKGADGTAFKIRQIAVEHGIPVVEEPALARALHASVAVDGSIPPELYMAVAKVILFVRKTAERSGRAL